MKNINLDAHGAPEVVETLTKLCMSPIIGGYAMRWGPLMSQTGNRKARIDNIKGLVHRILTDTLGCSSVGNIRFEITREKETGDSAKRYDVVRKGIPVAENKTMLNVSLYWRGDRLDTPGPNVAPADGAADVAVDAAQDSDDDMPVAEEVPDVDMEPPALAHALDDLLAKDTSSMAAKELEMHEKKLRQVLDLCATCATSSST